MEKFINRVISAGTIPPPKEGWYLFKSDSTDGSVMLPSDSDQTQAKVWRDFLNGLKSKPMTIIELAGHFEICRKKMASVQTLKSVAI